MSEFISVAVVKDSPQGVVKSLKPRRYWTGEGAYRKIRITFRPVREISFAGVILGGKPCIAGNDGHLNRLIKQRKC